MGKFIRLALMFGPMIYKGAKKLMAMRNSKNETPPATPSDGRENDDQENDPR